MKWFLSLLFIIPQFWCYSIHNFKRKGGSRIINGRKAYPNEFPWVTMVYIIPSSKGGNLDLCGGSIVSPNYVISAQHCVKKIPISKLKIIAGFHKISDFKEKYRQVRDVFTVFYYKDPKKRTTDICMIKVTQPFQMTGKVGTISLPLQHSMPKDNQLCSFTGVGLIKESPPIVPEYLQVTYIPIIPKNQCAKFQHLEEFEFCSGKKDGGACKGDSGGGLICKDDTKKMVLTGVVFGFRKQIPCGHPDYPAVYTRVSYFIDWILYTLKL